MSREYTSAARRAAATAPAVDDPTGLLAWVGTSTVRARQALAQLEAAPLPADADADQRAAREQLVDQLLDVFPSFVLDGEPFRVMGEMQLLDLCELLKLTKRRVKTVDPAAVSALADFYAGALGVDEYERFRTFVRDNAIDQDVLNDVMEGIVEDLTDRPTSRPSPSASGPSTTGAMSKVVSLSGPQRGVVLQPAAAPPDFAAMSPQEFADWHANQTRGVTSFG
ncbi:hypothetical protein ACIA59_20135 [Micromonospora haikouensis]|uniref:hypothetical protein n=1 Tax=Micromonospora haikouensis TaxID=686309 RepID=UPI0037A07502